MEASIIISAVAVGVSVLSVAANVYLARQSRKAGLEVLRAKAELDRIDATTKSIKEMEVEGERLRIRCWGLMDKIDSLRYGRGQKQRGIVDDAVHAFSNQAALFIDSWAKPKTDFPVVISKPLQDKRHICRNLINRIESSLPLATIQEGGYEGINTLLKELLQELESFIMMTAISRRAMLRGESDEMVAKQDA